MTWYDGSSGRRSAENSWWRQAPLTSRDRHCPPERRSRRVTVHDRPSMTIAELPWRQQNVFSRIHSSLGSTSMESRQGEVIVASIHLKSFPWPHLSPSISSRFKNGPVNLHSAHSPYSDVLVLADKLIHNDPDSAFSDRNSLFDLSPGCNVGRGKTQDVPVRPQLAALRIRALSRPDLRPSSDAEPQYGQSPGAAHPCGRDRISCPSPN